MKFSYNGKHFLKMKKNNSPLPVIPLRDQIESLPLFHNLMSNIGEKMHPNQMTSLRISFTMGTIGLAGILSSH
jgi:hypothetical protein